jgi:ribosomal protein S15P/S13E
VGAAGVNVLKEHFTRHSKDLASQGDMMKVRRETLLDTCRYASEGTKSYEPLGRWLTKKKIVPFAPDHTSL